MLKWEKKAPETGSRPELHFKHGPILVDFIRVAQWIPDQVLILEIQTRQKYAGGMVSTGSDGTLGVHLMVDDNTLSVPEQDDSLGMTEVMFKAPPGDWQVQFCSGRYTCQAIFYRELPDAKAGIPKQDGTINWGA